MNQLKLLNLGGNLIRKIPDDLGNCNNLTCLFLEKNKIERLTGTLASLPLERIDCGGNPITAIAPALQKLHGLTINGIPLRLSLKNWISSHQWATGAIIATAVVVLAVASKYLRRF